MTDRPEMWKRGVGPLLEAQYQVSYELWLPRKCDGNCVLYHAVSKREQSWETGSRCLRDVDSLTHSHTMTPFQAPGKQAF